jgi:hypothetical protein
MPIVNQLRKILMLQLMRSAWLIPGDHRRVSLTLPLLL